MLLCGTESVSEGEVDLHQYVSLNKSMVLIEETYVSRQTAPHCALVSIAKLLVHLRSQDLKRRFEDVDSGDILRSTQQCYS